MQNKTLISLVALLLILAFPALHMVSQIFTDPLSHPANHALKYKAPSSNIAKLLEIHDPEAIIWALQNPEKVAQQQGELDDLFQELDAFRTLLDESLASSDTLLDPKHMMRVSQAFDRLGEHLTRLDTSLGCPKGHPLSLGVCNKLPRIRAEHELLRSMLFKPSGLFALS